jgi:WD40 repeat protein
VFDHRAAVYAVAFAPDGRTLAIGGADATVGLVDVNRCQLRLTLPRQGGGIVSSLAFSPDGRALAVGADLRITLWDVATGRQRPELSGHHPIAFAPDGKMLAFASRPTGVQLWELATGRPVGPRLAPGQLVFALAYSPDGRTLATVAHETAQLWDLEGRCLSTLRGHTEMILGMAFAPDGATLATASEDHAIRLWEVASGQELATLEGHDGPVTSLAFSSDGRWLASASKDKTVRLWDLGGPDTGAPPAGCALGCGEVHPLLAGLREKPLKIRGAFPHVSVAGRTAGYNEGPGTLSVIP